MSKQQAAMLERNHVGQHFKLGIRFHLWASSLNAPPDWKAVRDRFEVSRATAYRFIRSWKDAAPMHCGDSHERI